MKITLKNNPTGTTKEIRESAEFFLKEMIGNDKIKGLGTVSIRFKRMGKGIGGSAINNVFDQKNYKINICKYQSMSEIKRILAHECCHIKQYFLKELTYKTEFKHTLRGTKRKLITIWKGRESRRSTYRTRGWEVEARKAEALSTKNIKLAKAVKALKEEEIALINKPYEPKKVVVTNKVDLRMVRVLNGGVMKNELFMKIMLEGINSRIEKDEVFTKVFNMKKYGILEEVVIGGVVYIKQV